MTVATGSSRRSLLANVLVLAAFVLVAAPLTALSDHPAVVGAFFAAILIPLAMKMVIDVWSTGPAQVVEIGTIYLAIVAVYTIYPLLSFIGVGYSYTPLNDSRLFSAQPSPAQIASL